MHTGSSKKASLPEMEALQGEGTDFSTHSYKLEEK